MPPALELRNIVKRFPGVVANDHISFAVDKGEIRALVGENGAGKTTLMNILYGLYRPDSGEILIDGIERRFHSPLDAIRAGLGMVHQHFMLFPSLTVAENIIFGAEPATHGVVDRAAAQAQVSALASRYRLEVDPRARVEDLPVGVRQRVEILKMLYRGAEILILDEPTAVLTPHERERLFAVLRALAEAGKTIVFITHKLGEVLALSHRATVLRDGAVTGTVETADTTESALCRLMVGRDVELRLGKAPSRPSTPPVVQIRGLTTAPTPGSQRLRGLDLEVHGGEIVGIAGAAGNGQTELVEAIAGLRTIADGRILLGGEDVTHYSPAQRRRAGQSHIPEDRDGVGLALAASLADNLLMGFEERAPLLRRGVLSPGAVERHVRPLLATQGVKATSTAEPADNLSGGNRQKLVVARELAHRSRLLIAEQPTRGVDIAATEQIYRQLIDYRDHGNAILLVSTDLSEILALADRIVVMFEGRIAGEQAAAAATEESIGLLMGRGAAG